MLAQQLINGLSLGAVYALVAVAFTVSIGVLNFLNFSIPALFMISGMVSLGLMKSGFPWMLAVALGIATSIVASLVVERFTFKWMTKSGHLVPLVSSLAFLILFENLAIICFGSDLLPFPRLFGGGDGRLGGVVIGLPQILSLLIAVAAVALLAYVLKATALGRSVRAISESPQTATILGVQTGRIVLSVYALAGLLAGLAGILFAVNYAQVSWVMGEEVGLKGISAMILGGMGNIWGAVIGGLLIGLLEVLTIAYVSSDAVNLIVYGTLILVLVLKPTGLFGDRLAARERF